MTLSRRIAAGFGIAALIAWRVFAIDHDVASVAPPGADVVGSQLFCAKSALYTEDGGVAYQWEVQYPCPPDQTCPPPPPFRSGDTSLPMCWSNRLMRSLKTPVLHKAEIRGWIAMEAAGFNWDDDEYTFVVSLDTGWTPDPAAQAAGVQAINSLALVNQYITPMNVIDQGINRTLQDMAAFGGPGAAMIKVEVDGWGPQRTTSGEAVICNNGPDATGSSSCYYPFQMEYIYPSYVATNTIPGVPTVPGMPSIWSQENSLTDLQPNGVVGVRPDGRPVKWGFVLPFLGVPAIISHVEPVANASRTYQQVYTPGKYVRVVGDLWMDEPHIYSDPNSGGRGCWDTFDSFKNKLGWTEIHTADYISVLDPPPITTRLIDNKGNRSIAMYTLCSTSLSGAGVSETILPRKPTNMPGAKIASFVAAVNQDRTYQGGESHTSGVDRYSVELHVPVTGYLQVAYEATWICDPVANCANKCGGIDDGCGSTCSQSCSTGYTCSAGPDANGYCQCNAPGYILCPTSGLCVPTTQCCGGNICASGQVCSASHCCPSTSPVWCNCLGTPQCMSQSSCTFWCNQ